MKRHSGLSPKMILAAWKVCRVVIASAFVATSFTALSACGEEAGPAPRPIDGVAQGGGGAGGSGETGGFAGSGNGGMGGSVVVCVEGAKKDCKVYVGENNGVKTCFEGVQYCTNGKWGLCGPDKPAP